MNSRNLLNITLALTLVALVILAVYEPGSEEPTTKVSLTTLKDNDVQKIIIEQIQQPRLVLQKSNDQWNMSEPFSVPANALRINKFLAISHTTSHSRYSLNDIDLTKLKLHKPELILYLDNTKLAFGTTDALNGFRYIQIDNTIHLTTDRYSHLIRGQATALISPGLIPKNATISRLTLPGLKLMMDGNGWRVENTDTTLNTDLIHQLLDEWRHARAMQVSRVIKASTSSSNQQLDPVDTQVDMPIEVQINDNETIRFVLSRTEDEIILTRTELGIRYHFETDVGERLLKIPTKLPTRLLTTKTDSMSSN